MQQQGEAAPAQPTPAAGGAVVDARTGDLHFGAARRGCRCRAERIAAIRIEQDVLGANNQVAQHNRAHFRPWRACAQPRLQPRLGKTTLLCATIRACCSSTPSCRWR